MYEEGKSPRRTIASGTVAVACAVLVVWLVGGCASPEERARTLFGQGKYEEIVQKYSDTPMAEQAREKLAEKLYNDGKYDEVLKNYGQTPIAAKAKQAIDEGAARKLLDAKDFEGVLKQYPNTQTATAARDSLADRLNSDPDKWEKLQAQFPQIGDGSAKSQLASQEFQRIMRLPMRQRTVALETFVQNPQFQRTLAVAKARKELATMKK